MTTLKTLALSGAIAALALGPLQAEPQGETMTQNISVVLSFDVKDGKESDFQDLMADLVESSREEEGTLNYEWYRTGDTVHTFERFVDNDAMMEHLSTFGEKYVGRFVEIASVNGLTIYGPADERVREREPTPPAKARQNAI